MTLRGALSLAPLWLGACLPQPAVPHGEQSLGTFTFIGQALEDSCLSTRYAGSLTFSATLSYTKDDFYFGGPGGLLHGTIAGQTFSVTFGGTEQIDRLCQITREETLSATITGTTLSGNYLARVIPVAGTNCIAAVVGPARQFATLPCAVRYGITGTRTDSPDGGGDGGADGGAADGGTSRGDGGS